MISSQAHIFASAGQDVDESVNENTMKSRNSVQNSFAYTSGKVVPKYSPARSFKPGQQNIPMSYAGPPSKDELTRNAMRHTSGNRNF
jgi:hypothetical protein